MRTISVVAGLALIAPTAIGGVSGPASVAWLNSEADTIVVARVLTASTLPDGGVSAQLDTLRILKGTSVPPVLQVELKPSPILKMNAGSARNLPNGNTGLWFLRTGTGGKFDILPTDAGDYIWGDACYLAVPDAGPGGAAGSIGERVLTEIIGGYRSVAADQHPGQEWKFHSAIISSAPEDVRRALGRLYLDSNLPLRMRVVALAGEISHSFPDAILRLDRDFELLSKDERFGLILWDISYMYKCGDPATVAPLIQLLSRRRSFPRLEEATAGALARTGNKHALRGLALLLDSSDRQTQFRASRAFWQFAEFANEEGEISVGTERPWRSDEARQLKPEWKSFLQAPDRYVGFWKKWWAENRGRLGYAE